MKAQNERQTQNNKNIKTSIKGRQGKTKKQRNEGKKLEGVCVFRIART